LALFNNIPRQPDDALETLLAKRQLNIKENNSTSWFVTIKKKLYKYDLPNPLSLLDSPVKKNEWKNIVKKVPLLMDQKCYQSVSNDGFYLVEIHRSADS
jgi:hypothetical protein